MHFGKQPSLNTCGILFYLVVPRRKQAIQINKFPFTANSRAKITDDTKGFIKIIKDKYDKILGGVIINNRAGDMIHELVVAMTFEASSEDLRWISHAHPTMSEAFQELYDPTHI